MSPTVAAMDNSFSTVQRFETRLERLPVDAIESRVLVSKENVDKVQFFCDKNLVKEFGE